MDSARQVIRWALPGWIAYFYWLLFFTTHLVINGLGNASYFNFLNKLDEYFVPLGIASIPLGFILYQVYYWLYWYAPLPYFLGRFVNNPFDRGRRILMDWDRIIDFRKYFGRSIIPVPPAYGHSPKFFTKKDIKIMMDYQSNWHLADSVWYSSLGSEKNNRIAEMLERRNNMLADIYHSLGACYTALMCSYPGYLIALFFLSHERKLINTSQSLIASMIINFGILCFSLYIFRCGRRSSFAALYSLKHDVIASVLGPCAESSKVEDPYGDFQTKESFNEIFNE